MAARVGLSTEELEAKLSPGETAIFPFILTNNGTVVDAFNLTVRGLEQTWYTVAPAQVSLFPETQAVAMLTVTPPPGMKTLAGVYPFEVVATSRDKPDDFTSVSLMITLAAEGDLALDLEPQRVVARRGTFTLALMNAANMPRPLALRPSDAEEVLLFAFGEPRQMALQAPGARGGTPVSPDAPTAQFNVSEGRPVGEAPLTAPMQAEWTAPGGEEGGQGMLEITLPPNSRVEIPLTAYTKKRYWFGREMPLRFEVAATPPGVEWEPGEARRVSGELVYMPYLAAWSALPLAMRRLLAIAIPLALLALLLFLLLRPQDAPVVATTGTPTAVAVVTPSVPPIAGGGGLGSETPGAGGGAGTGGTGGTGDTGGTGAGGTGTGGTGAGGTGTGGTGAGGTGTGGANAANKPQIVKFDWVFATQASDQVTVTWEVTNAASVTLNDAAVPTAGDKVIDITDDQSLTLVAKKGDDVVSLSKGVLVLDPPVIQSFAAQPTEACAGCEVTLTWNTNMAERVFLDNQPVPETDGSMKVTPGATTEYVLAAENPFGRTEMLVTVNVTAP